MAFNISEFKTRIDRFGGPARTSLFTVQLIGGPQNDFIKSDDLLFFCKNTTLPGIDINTVTHRPHSIDLPQSFPTAINSEPLNCIFMMDSQHRVLAFFHRWMQKVVNYSTAAGNFASVNDQLPYEVGYKDEYSCRMVIRHYSTELYLGSYYEVVLDEVFPTTVQSVDLGWENNDSFATLPVAFSYGKISFAGEVRGTTTSLLSRGGGLLDLITSLGTIGQTIDQITAPTSIQDAINTFTRANTALNTIQNLIR